MARRTKEDAETTRLSLLDAAERVFMRRGVSRSSLEEIAKEAGLTRGALYWHFENKIALFRAMHERVKSPMDVMFEQLTTGEDPLTGLKTMCLHILNTIEQDEHARNVFTIMRLRCEDYNCDESEFAAELDKKHKEVHAKLTRTFTDIAKKHPLAPGITPEFAALALHSFLSGIFWDYLRAPDSYPISTHAPQLTASFFRGIMA